MTTRASRQRVPRRLLSCQSRLLAISLLLALPCCQSRSAESWDQARQRMVEEVIVAGGIKNPRVVEAMKSTPRHEFLAPAMRDRAYQDMALPIGEQQTISSPFIVAYMTEALDPQPHDRVLEIGTGSGYQAAVLSPLVQDVYTIEIVEPLGRRAERTLQRLQYANVHVRVGDGFEGWPDQAPFDKVIVTCSPEKVPQPIVDQLREGGLIVIPVGERYQQTLYLLRKRNGRLESEKLLPVLFVPMTGRAEEIRQRRPDPANPQAVNGDFEEPPEQEGTLPGWYYERQAAWVEHEGGHCATFRNQASGNPAHALQGLPLDGRAVAEVELSARVRFQDVEPGRQVDERPAVVLTLYDEQRKELGHWWLGPFRGSTDWRQESTRIRVSPKAREGILRIGLFGATGEIAFDDVKLEVVSRR